MSAMSSAEEYIKRAAEAREQAERSFRPSDKEAWFQLAEDWTVLQPGFETSGWAYSSSQL
jgi:hypothetical protein